MRDYELVLVVSPEGGEDGFPVTVGRVHAFISERGGEVKNIDAWGRRRLAYPVEKRFTEGYYNITQFTIDPEHIRPLENSLDLAEDILRHLVVRLEEPIVIRPPAEAEPEPKPPAETPPEAPETTETVAEETAAEEPAPEAAAEIPEDAAEEAGTEANKEPAGAQVEAAAES